LVFERIVTWIELGKKDHGQWYNLNITMTAKKDQSPSGNVKKWSKSDLYPTKNPISTRPIRVLLIEESKPRFINYKSTYHRPYLSAVITRANNKRNRKNKINKNTTLVPLYDGPLPIKKAKLNDLLHLK
jgi:hypothetical protein